MPQASGGRIKYAWMDHDTAMITETPPIQNQWYTVIDDEDVRILVFALQQQNDEQGAVNLEISWTLDGTQYILALAANDTTIYYIYRTIYPSALPNSLGSSVTWENAMFQGLDKRALDALLEVRMTGAGGTNQILSALSVYETLEAT